MKIAALIARLLLGLVFVVFGANFFLRLITLPPMPPPAQDFIGALFASGYLMQIAHAIEIVGGLLLLSGFFVPLGLTLLGPVIVNIVLFDTILAPDNAPVAIGVGLLEVFLIWRYGSYFRPLFSARAAAS